MRGVGVCVCGGRGGGGGARGAQRETHAQGVKTRREGKGEGARGREGERARGREGERARGREREGEGEGWHKEEGTTGLRHMRAQ